MEPLVIRKATAADLEILFVFEQGVVRAERPFDATLKQDPVNYYDLEGMITDDEVELVVAVSGTRIVGSGYARIEPAKPYLQHNRHAYLGFMYVEPDFRGKGVNNMVIDVLAVWAVSRNVYELRLDVYDGNLPAIKAYEKAGFNRHLLEMRKAVTMVLSLPKESHEK